MGYQHFHQTYFESFVTKSKEAYTDSVGTPKLKEKKSSEKLFKGLDIERKLRKVKTEQEFVAKTLILCNRLCKHIKGRRKQYEFAQKLDNILISIVKEMKVQESKENLQQAAKLQKMIGHTLQRFRSVCGYGLSGVYMNFEIKMLKEGKDKEEIENFIGKKMKTVAELQHKKITDLVTFVVIGKLPVLYADKHLQVNIGHQNGMQSVGVLFEVESEPGFFFSTCTHGEDITEKEVKVQIGNGEFTAQYWGSVYVKPDEEAPRYNQEKDVHTPNVGGSLTGDESGIGSAAMDTSDNLDPLSNEQDRMDEYQEKMEVDENACGLAALCGNTSESPLDSGAANWIDSPTQEMSHTNTGEMNKFTPIYGQKSGIKRAMSEKANPTSEVSPIKRKSKSLINTDDTRSPKNVLYNARPSSTPYTTPRKPSTVSFSDSGFETSSQRTSISSSISEMNEDLTSPIPILSSTPRPEESYDRSAALNRLPQYNQEMSFQQQDDVSTSQQRNEPHTQGNRPDSRCPHPNRESSGGHIDLCLFKAIEDNVGRPDRDGYFWVEDMVENVEEILKEKVRKYGVKTGVTEGYIVNINCTLKCIFRRKTVWIKDMIVTGRHHNYEQMMEVARHRSDGEPVRLTQDARMFEPARTSQGQSSPNVSAEAQGAVGGASREVTSNFVAPGDSGACITTSPSGDIVRAIACHLYHFECDEIVYSVSCPLFPSVRKLELKMGKKLKIRPTPVITH